VSDEKVTPRQEADPADEFLTAAEQRWETAENARWQDYPTALEHLGKALRSTADVPLLLRAVRAVREIHWPREITETTVCTAHASGSKWRRSATLAEFRAETRACPDCLEIRKVICDHCGCPNDEWPCPTSEAITRALTGENDA
jgi:hypothetical protein